MKNIKKYGVLILTVAIMLMMLTACGGTNDKENNEESNTEQNTTEQVSSVVIPDGYTEYEDSTSGLKFAYPSNWINVGTDQIPVFADSTTGTTVNLVTESITTGMSLSSYVTASKSAVQSAFTIDGTIDEEDVKVNGVDAVKLTYSTTQSGIDMTLQQVIMVKGQKAYVITFGSQASVYNDVKDTFDKILSTVQL